MKIAINAWSFPSNLTIPQGLKIAKRAGFDAVELNLSEDEYLRLDMSDAEVAGFRISAENMSLELRSVSSGLMWKYPLTSPDPGVVTRAKEIVRRGLEVTRILGADTLLVVPGVVEPDVPYDVAFKRSREALGELAADAKRRKVCIGIENVWNKFLLSPLEMRDFIDTIGSEWVQAYFDVGNVLVSGYPQHWIRILGGRIKKVHVKDFHVSIGNLAGFTNPLQGDVDWIAVRNALREIGYDDVVTAEIPGYKTMGDLGVRHAGEALGRLFKGTGREPASVGAGD